MSFEILDPTHEGRAAAFEPASRLGSLAGATVGIVSNGKQGTRPFFDAFERVLLEEHGVGAVVRVTKANYSARAEPAILEQAVSWDALVAGVGD